MRRALVMAAATLVALGFGDLSASVAAAATPVTAPTIVSPSDGDSVSGNPLFAWGPVAGASSYHLQVATGPSFVSPVIDAHTVAARYTPDSDLPLGTLYWRVAGTGSTNVDGPFSDPVQFARTWSDSPVLDQPADGVDLTFPTDPALFSWNPVPGASKYTLELATSPDFLSATTYSTVNTSYTLTAPQPVGQIFYWRVQAVGTNGVVTDPSATRSFRYTWNSKPTLIAPDPSPEDGTVTDVELRWNAVPGAASYEFEISPNGDWANNVTMDDTVHGTAYTLPTTLNNGSYFWRVRAIDESGDLGTWSDQDAPVADSFTRSWPNAPTQLEPRWNPATPDVVPHVPASLDLSWTPVDHAAYYQLQVSADVNFSPATIMNCYTNHTEWTPYTANTLNLKVPGGCSITVSLNGLYYWRVRGVDAPSGVLGAWSTPAAGPWRFVVDPNEPMQLAPADGATVSVPTVSWQPVPTAQSYEVTILDASGASIVSAKPTDATSFTPQDFQLLPGSYTWFVQAVSSSGAVSAAPGAEGRRGFTLVEPTTGTTEQLTAPADGASFALPPRLSWQPVTGATTYDVYASSAGGTQQLAAGLVYPAYTDPQQSLASGTYAWWVVAKNAGGAQVAVSGTRTFTVTTNMTLGSGDYLPLGNCGVDDVCGDTPTFSWHAYPHAALYLVTIANDPAFTNVARSYTTSYTTLTPRESLPDNQAGQAYYWFVRPCLDTAQQHCGPGPDDPVVGQNAPSFAKHSAPVELMSPADGGSRSGPITFRWRDYLTTGSGAIPRAQQEAAQYKLRVSTVPDFSTVLDTQLLDGTSYTPVTGYPNGPLYWQVQAVDGSGQLLTASPVREVMQSAEAPTIEDPVNGSAVGGVPFLQWSPTSTAATYAIEVYKNGDEQFSPANRVLTATTAFSAWSPVTGLPAGLYAWRVHAVDGSGRVGPWSAGSTFSLGADMPQLTGPTEHLTSSSDVLFSWEPVAGAAAYKWQLAGDIGFTHVVASQTTVMTSWVPRSTFADGTYFWRVAALDGSGNQISVSTASPQWQITKDSVVPRVTALTPSSAADVAAGFTVTFSEPVTGVTTSSFTVTPSGGTAPVPGTVTAAADATSAVWRPDTPLIAGQTYHVALSPGITDVAGNPLTAFGQDVRTSTAMENGSPAWAEHWARVATARAFGGSYDWSDAKGATISLPFTGPVITLVGTKSPAGGYAAVSVDGVRRAAKVSFHAAAASYRATVWSGRGLGDGAHLLTVTVLGTKPAGSAGARVAVDAARVGAVTTDQSAPGVVETFDRVRSSAASGGSYDTASFASSTGGAAPSYVLTFRGTHVTLYGLMSPASGSATVYIDGAKQGTVTLRSAATQYDYPVYSSAALSDRVHTVRVNVVGSRTGARSAVGLDRAVAS